VDSCSRAGWFENLLTAARPFIQGKMIVRLWFVVAIAICFKTPRARCANKIAAGCRRSLAVVTSDKSPHRETLRPVYMADVISRDSG
jgi:hypothetical protein